MRKNKRWIFGIILMVLTAVTLETAHAGYRSVVAKWTKTGRIYRFETLDADVIWNATLMSDELISAQRDFSIKRKVNFKEPDITGIAFFLNLYTKPFLKGFSLDEKSTWKIYLVGADGLETPANSIDKANFTPTEMVLYPHLNKWSKQYVVHFPSIDLGQEPKLIMRSIVAESTLKWDLKKLLSAKK